MKPKREQQLNGIHDLVVKIHDNAKENIFIEKSSFLIMDLSLTNQPKINGYFPSIKSLSFMDMTLITDT